MKLLLDTHALLWWLSGDSKLSSQASAQIADPNSDVLVSVVSLWEIVVKIRIGKLAADITAIERAIATNGFLRLPLTPLHLTALTALPVYHRDPFDHLLIAQALSEGAVLMTEDENLARYPGTKTRC